VILRSEAPADGAQTAHGYRAYVGLIGSSELTALGTYDSLVSGPSGSVALTLAWDWTLTPQPHYVVMSGATLSEPRDGYPVAWSPDGSELAVFHVTEVGGGIDGHPAGWLEVVRSTGVSVASARSVRTGIISQVAFSPDGARVAFGDDTNAAVQGERIGVLEIGTGSLRRIPGFGPFTWASSDELLIADHSSEIPSQNNRILSWSETTAQLTTYGAGNIVGASGRGAVVTGTDGTGSLSWVNRSPGDTASETLTLGAGPWMGIPDAAWSPYGESLVLISGDEFSALMDAVLVHP
jgi:Tol biopolymer transport system component